MSLLRSLPKALIFNAIFSSICGILLITLADWWSMQLAAINPNWILAGGAMLILFAGQLVLMVKLERFESPLVMSVIVSDLGYVAFAIAIVVWQFGQLSVYGIIFLLATAVVVGDLAAWQFHSLRHRVQR